MTIRVYTLPGCVQCTATHRNLLSQGIQHETIDLTENPEVAAELKALGYRSAPIVVTENGHWSGFRPDLLATITA
ncbi:glutaredoxin domain-containing protein [Rathayibacter rathayi]|uniref:NrdH-redoxin n=1 Tax=Rathayibacter rathayi TaxID=33887 RepID=A0ABD6W6F9_RATRA|nr:glutaredoxin domain-containing protein [Rathayibacter rathayi]MWV76033.1 NrdH-redoxin [Rathayibacter rathayi NCPPB 2980 = VKM Ac-1601]PPF11960.1 NrdH-redoxin [Rathayibacter rathayi]PPF42434.1 NrdH-redoxin [Rathayibacter rathayi]PPF74811.1 NrdH-redoxin [Rathayibacter rathayi]PPG09276.1 NrdH-redoxin [Rathayibacter rathayi]